MTRPIKGYVNAVRQPMVGYPNKIHIDENEAQRNEDSSDWLVKKRISEASLAPSAEPAYLESILYSLSFFISDPPLVVIGAAQIMFAWLA